MTDEEKFRFDLTGFLVRPAILERDEIDAIVDQIDRIHHDNESPNTPNTCLLYTSPSPRDRTRSRMPSSA